MLRRDFFGSMAAGTVSVRLARAQQQGPSGAGEVFIERPATEQPHQGKVLLAVQAPSDEIAPVDTLNHLDHNSRRPQRNIVQMSMEGERNYACVRTFGCRAIEEK